MFRFSNRLELTIGEFRVVATNGPSSCTDNWGKISETSETVEINVFRGDVRILDTIGYVGMREFLNLLDAIRRGERDLERCVRA